MTFPSWIPKLFCGALAGFASMPDASAERSVLCPSFFSVSNEAQPSALARAREIAARVPLVRQISGPQVYLAWRRLVTALDQQMRSLAQAEYVANFQPSLVLNAAPAGTRGLLVRAVEPFFQQVYLELDALNTQDRITLLRALALTHVPQGIAGRDVGLIATMSVNTQRFLNQFGLHTEFIREVERFALYRLSETDDVNAWRVIAERTADFESSTTQMAISLLEQHRHHPNVEAAIYRTRNTLQNRLRLPRPLIAAWTTVFPVGYVAEVTRVNRQRLERGVRTLTALINHDRP